MREAVLLSEGLLPIFSAQLLVELQALLNADVNGDGQVNSDDLTKHARYVGGIITSWDQN